jgi:hypothetical protein
MKQAIQIRQLSKELEAFAQQVPALAIDNVFVAWFLRAYLTESDTVAIQAVTGGTRDKGVDAVLVDDKARVVYVVQAKYRKIRFGALEQRASVIDFCRLSHVICDPDDAAFSEFLRGMDAAVVERMREVRRHVCNGDHRLMLIFVTLGKFGAALEREANLAMRRTSRDSSIELIDGPKTLLLLKDYLDGAAPPIPTLDVPIEAGSGVKVNGVLQRYDAPNNLESWVFSVRGNAIARMFEIGGRRLFARNIRGFLGDTTSVNEGMRSTITKEPGYFFYYNNGITIVCDRAEKVSHKGSDILRVSNPQVINGQQTSRVLSDSARSKDASVLIKVIQVPRDPMKEERNFDGLISRIVQATNWQNAIKPADLMANDRKQVEIEKALRHRDYFYARKRQTKGEIRAQMRGRRQLIITKEELAQAVAGAELDPVIARSGKDNLFTESLYDQVFPNTDANYYLPRYWLFSIVTQGARGAPRWGYTKWMVLGFLWTHLSSILNGDCRRRSFSDLARRNDGRLLKPLNKAVDLTYRQALAYYERNKGRGEAEVDISLFFRRKKGRDAEFRRFWRRPSAAPKRSTFSGALQRVREAVESQA